jgi:hypothetical protein
MRTILVLALAANVFFSFGSGYLQGAIVNKAAANTVSVASNTAVQSIDEARAF